MQEAKDKMNRGYKDSVFVDLFNDKKYLLDLYRHLHPEDSGVSEDDVKNITISNVLAGKMHNDLGFTAGNRFKILVEEQSSWSDNIVWRLLIYVAETYKKYFNETSYNLFSTTVKEIPKPEFYVVYTGENPKITINKISISEKFFNGEKIPLDLEATVITNDNPLGGVLSEYMNFVAIVEEQIKIYGRTEKAIKEAVKICKDTNILKEYLEKRESEVISMLDGYYSQEDVTNMMLREAEDIGKEKGAREAAVGMAADGISLETIAKIVKYPLDTVKMWVGSSKARI